MSKHHGQFFEYFNKCPHCGFDVSHYDNYCDQCGNEIGELVCKKCGHINRAIAKFCAKCGVQNLEKPQPRKRIASKAIQYYE